ncbi:M20 aminoacylase family protein [Vibrio salinus]|uniref:M20 aminoacylase family protein n=1 Tax=Vibrio salinus TaxID=2899784 RepID=UPI001E2B9317|nr:M20 aminoacylase family protein [Vibrio salinus]MCE0496212.1 M20 family metallopeptidase [Vibrio salinus]
MTEYIKPYSEEHHQLVTWRRDLHAHPETAYEEFRTSDIIAEKLTALGLDVYRGLGKTGIVATLHGRLGDGKTIGLRADMDALNLDEQNTFAHCSKHQGKMHACGHDGHTTMLLGAAVVLAENPDFKGTVHFIFQPAEENEAGARSMIEDGLFEKFPMSEVYGLHNWPGLPAGQAGVHEGAVMAAFDTFDITIKGIGGHGAMPDKTADPIYTATQVVSALQGIISRNLDPQKSGVISVTQINGGYTYNVIPEEVTLKGTTRSFSPDVRDLIESRMKDVVTGIAAAQGCQAEILYSRRYPATINTVEAAKKCYAVLEKMPEIEQVHLNPPASMGGEDFAFMLEKCPGAYIWLGNGSQVHSHDLHSANYDFNDDVLPIGANFWIRMVEQLLSE